MIRYTLLTSLSIAVLLTGCGNIQQHEYDLEVDETKMTEYLADKPKDLQRLYKLVLLQGERNSVLNHMRIGVAAMETGHDNLARQSFDEAINRINAVYADNPEARKARSKWVKENAKEFKGEPYERAMAYYYRGLLALKEGDYENARAYFKSGYLQDGLTQNIEDEMRKDFALLSYLDGWSSHCLGQYDKATTMFDEASQIEPNLPLPNQKDNLLLIAELGHGPIKIAEGEYDEILTYEPGASVPEKSASFRIGDDLFNAIFAENIYYQASTQGKRQVDNILNDKAEFKENSDNIAEASLYGSKTMTDSMNQMMYTNPNAAMTAGYAGIALSAISLVAMATSENTEPAADIRYWDSLPHSIHLTVTSTEGTPRSAYAEVSYRDEEGKELPSLTKGVEITENNRCALGWTRSQSALSVPDRAPNSGYERN